MQQKIKVWRNQGCRWAWVAVVDDVVCPTQRRASQTGTGQVGGRRTRHSIPPAPVSNECRHHCGLLVNPSTSSPETACVLEQHINVNPYPNCSNYFISKEKYEKLRHWCILWMCINTFNSCVDYFIYDIMTISLVWTGCLKSKLLIL